MSAQPYGRECRFDWGRVAYVPPMSGGVVEELQQDIEIVGNFGDSVESMFFFFRVLDLR